MTNNRKVFLTYDEQLDLLLTRGLTISDIAAAKHYLEYFGYFELVNGYKDLFLKTSLPRNIPPQCAFL